ncbi:hypothetical protein PGB90_003853 [Kerria lacca]
MVCNEIFKDRGDMYREKSQKESSEDVRWFFRKRYYLTFMVFYGMVICVLLRTNLSIAMVDMTSSKIITIGNSTYIQEAEFKWTSVDKGIILSSFSWAYFLSAIGGLLANKYGGVTVFGIGILITGLLTVLSPLFVRLNTILFITGRILEGIAEGCAITASIQISANWIPPQERSRAIGFLPAGMYIGAAIAFPVCGFATSSYGWEMMFAITGGIAFIWCIILYVFFKNDPSADRFIAKKEKIYLSKNIVEPLTSKIIYPWKRIFMSAPVLAYFNERLLMACITETYKLLLLFADVNKMAIDNIGLISSIPNISSFLGAIVGSVVSDYIRNKKLMSKTNAAKLLCISTKLICLAVLVIMIFYMDFWCTIISLSVFRFFYSSSEACIIALPLDLSPHHASVITGLAYIFASIGYVINPIIMGLIVQNHKKEGIGFWKIGSQFKFGVIVGCTENKSFARRLKNFSKSDSFRNNRGAAGIAKLYSNAEVFDYMYNGLATTSDRLANMCCLLSEFLVVKILRKTERPLGWKSNAEQMRTVFDFFSALYRRHATFPT